MHGVFAGSQLVKHGLTNFRAVWKNALELVEPAELVLAVVITLLYSKPVGLTTRTKSEHRARATVRRE